MNTKITSNTSTPVLIALIICCAMSLMGAPGDLDPTFGIGGKVSDLSGYGSYDVAIQKDGKIVAVGQGGVGVAVFRYNIDGSPDMTFGGTGRVFIDQYQVAIDVAIQPDGKIVIAGRDLDGEVFGVLIRLNSDGSLDTSFGTNGTLAAFLPSVSGIQKDGKLLVAYAARLYRLNNDGTFDMTFGECQPGSTIHYPNTRMESVIQRDGRIVTAFTIAESRFGAFRCNRDGTLDTSFGSGGVVITTTGSGLGVAHSIALQKDGKIVVTGQSQINSNSDWKLTVVRYNPNGSLDTGFGTGGMVTMPTGITYWLPPLDSVAIQADGRILVSSTTQNGSDRDFTLVRFDPNGSLDTTFGGGDGIATVDFDQANENANGMAIDGQGRAVVVGSSAGFALARILLAPRMTRFGLDGDSQSDR